MRVCSASAARILTLFSLALISSQSFILANAEDTPGTTDVANGADVPNPSPPLSSPVSSPAAIPTTTPTPSPPPTTSQAPTSSAQPPASSSTKPSSSTPIASSTPDDTEVASSTSADPASASQTSSSSASASASALSSSSSSSLSSASSSSSSLSASSSNSAPSSTGVTLRPATTVVASSAATRHVSTGTDTTSYGWLSPSASATDAVAANVSASHNGFFDNKGAVAGTFSVVGILALGAVIVGVVYAKRRAARLQDEEDMTYFEKYQGGNSDNHDAPGDLSFGNDNPSDAEMMTHAAPDAYPDRSMHYGLPTMDEYPQQPAMAYGVAPAGAGLEYPAGTAYARAQAHQGQQYQYEGYGATGYGADFNGQYQEAYYDPRRSPSSPTHPYADPRNSPRQEGAPPVGSNVDLVQGEAR
ncbi:hypothetical protein BC628DRAFT_1419808 [Trametes gibbosa]|nr:hypothetical protein BC628DRAFT_1419808 [Trametes gibbosa]